MPHKPPYFEEIRQEASGHWKVLEQNPKLAGPWRQLFSQIKSPRHVLSELIQNADDAGATWVKAGLADGVFTFEHDGEDFDIESFSSLCQFGISNKRFLHTIGFRGLGFKSTFSLGPRVQVYSPTLAIEFREKRFTEPVWMEDARALDHTRIRIAVSNKELESKVEADLERWVSSPVPLLFFRSIRELELQGEKIVKKVIDKGPVPQSEWVQLKTSSSKQRILHIQSTDESFPEDALEEIRHERGTDEKFDLPPCRVDLVVGLSAEQRLYVVLPTEVRPAIPFSCNAPFLQDPARNGIRELSMSVTNRWLLDRVGQLAAESMIGWLGNTELSAEERANAYNLLPEWTSELGSLAGEVTTQVAKSVSKNINGKNCLLTASETLSNRTNCLAVPAVFLDVWDETQALNIFGEGKKDVLSPEIDQEKRHRLESWDLVDEIAILSILRALAESSAIPRPESLELLVELWNFCKTALDNPAIVNYARHLKIVPVQENALLNAAKDVMTLGETGQKLSNSDLGFLLQRVPIVDSQWVDMLSRASKYDGKNTHIEIQTAFNLFQQLGLNQRVGVPQIIERIAQQVFAQQDPGEDGIKLVGIAVRGDVNLRPEIRSRFKFLCCDNQWHRLSEGLMVETESEIESLLPDAWTKTRLLHSKYQTDFRAGERTAWRKWTHENGLFSFPAPKVEKTTMWSRYEVERFCKAHGGEPPSAYRYKSENFQCEDPDFDAIVWKHWEQIAEKDPLIWVRIIQGIIGSWSLAWLELAKAQIRYASGAEMRPVEHTPLVSSWVLRFQGLPCLPDEHNKPQLPSTLFRTNADTSPLLGIERFVNEKLDQPQSQELLDLLGVRKKPESPAKLVERLRALSQAPVPPVNAIVDLYRALDKVAARLDAPKQEELRGIFERERLIYANDGSWQDRASIFQKNEDEIPGVAVVLNQIADLPLWSRLGVPEKTTLQRALNWLKTLRYQMALETADRVRVKALLRQAPNQVWSELNGWLDLDGRWEQPAKLQWHSFGAGNKERALFDWVKQRTADLSMLDRSIQEFPGTSLPSLDQVLHLQVANAARYEPKPLPSWLETLADTLARIRIEDGDADKSNRVADRDTAIVLKSAKWSAADKLEVEPSIEGQPAGNLRTIKAIWEDHRIYVAGSGPSHHRELVETLVARFRDNKIRSAIMDCTGRDPKFIDEYMSIEFTLLNQVPKTSKGGQNNDVVDDSEKPIVIAPPTHSKPEEKESPPLVQVPPARPSSTRVPRATREGPNQKLLEGLGFRWSDEHRYLVDNYGNTMQRGEGIFDYIKYNPDGNATDYYWIADKTLEEGIEVGYDEWQIMDRLGDKVLIVIPDLSGKLEVHKFVSIQRQVRRDELSLSPLVYLLRKPSK